jgi:hypothetical protein
MLRLERFIGGRPRKNDLRIVDVRIDGGDGRRRQRVAGVHPGENAVRLGGEIGRAQRRRVRRQCQRRGIERSLQFGVGERRTGVIDSHADQRDDNQQHDREDRQDAAAAVLQQASGVQESGVVHLSAPFAKDFGKSSPTNVK